MNFHGENGAESEKFPRRMSVVHSARVKCAQANGLQRSTEIQRFTPSPGFDIPNPPFRRKILAKVGLETVEDSGHYFQRTSGENLL
jgi:hypothetical protein